LNWHQQEKEKFAKKKPRPGKESLGEEEKEEGKEREKETGGQYKRSHM
jgi:hypothetical protein